MRFRTPLLGAFCALVSSFTFAQDKLSFSNQTIDIGLTVTRPVTVLNLYEGDEKELLVFGTDEKEKLWMIVLGANEQGKHVELDRLAVPENIIAFDMGVEQENGLQDIYFLTKSHIKRYVQAHKNQKSQLVNEQEISSVYLTDKPSFFRRKRFVRDLNEDKVDDFILPHFEHTNLWVSCECNTRHQQSIATSGQMDVFTDSINFRPPRLQYVDMNNDQNTDIVASELGKLNIYLQSEDGVFAEEPMVVNINQDIDSIYWWDLREADGSQKDQSNILHKVLEEVADVNGDDIADLVVTYTQGSSVLKQVNDFEFYFGEIVDGKLRYPTTPSTRIAIDERLTDISLVDLNDDKKMEALVSSFDISISDIVGALFSGKVKQDILVFGMNGNEQFESKPLVRDDVEIRFSLTSGQSGNPMVRLRDVNGDNLKDLLLSDGTDKVKVRLGDNSGDRAFVRRASSHDLNIPQNGQTITNEDVNGDGKSDLVMFYGRLDDKSLKNKIVITTSE